MLSIHQHVIDAVIAHARDDAPNECCGLLGGRGATIDAVMRARNLKQSATEYLVDPRDHFAAIRLWRTEGREVVGAYHSHPSSPAVPSAIDVRAALDAAFAYVIVSLQNADRPDLRAYRIAAGNFAPIAIVPVP